MASSYHELEEPTLDDFFVASSFVCPPRTGNAEVRLQQIAHSRATTRITFAGIVNSQTQFDLIAMPMHSLHEATLADVSTAKQVAFVEFKETDTREELSLHAVPAQVQQEFVVQTAREEIGTAQLQAPSEEMAAMDLSLHESTQEAQHSVRIGETLTEQGVLVTQYAGEEGQTSEFVLRGHEKPTEGSIVTCQELPHEQAGTSVPQATLEAVQADVFLHEPSQQEVQSVAVQDAHKEATKEQMKAATEEIATAEATTLKSSSPTAQQQVFFAAVPEAKEEKALHASTLEGTQTDVSLREPSSYEAQSVAVQDVHLEVTQQHLQAPVEMTTTTELSLHEASQQEQHAVRIRETVEEKRILVTQHATDEAAIAEMALKSPSPTAQQEVFFVDVPEEREMKQLQASALEATQTEVSFHEPSQREEQSVAVLEKPQETMQEKLHAVTEEAQASEFVLHMHERPAEDSAVICQELPCEETTTSVLPANVPEKPKDVKTVEKPPEVPQTTLTETQVPQTTSTETQVPQTTCTEAQFTCEEETGELSLLVPIYNHASTRMRLIRRKNEVGVEQYIDRPGDTWEEPALLLWEEWSDEYLCEFYRGKCYFGANSPLYVS